MSIFQNYPFLVPFLAYVATNSIKFILTSITEKKIIWNVWVLNGGMPSGHSAFVTSLCFFAFLEKGAGSFEFAILFILSMIVMRDSFGLRQDVGIHARFLNVLRKRNDNLQQEELNERVGHTFFQVFVGAIVGILVATVCSFTF